jgi:hypothetical protein
MTNVRCEASIPAAGDYTEAGVVELSLKRSAPETQEPNDGGRVGGEPGYREWLALAKE